MMIHTLTTLCGAMILTIYVGVLHGQSPQRHYDTIPYAMDYHQQRLNTFATERLDKGKMVVLGDSHIEFGDWRKHFVDTTIVNRGIAGDNTFGVLARLKSIIESSPKQLFLEVGINDIAKNIPNDIIIQNILKIVQQIRSGSPQTRICVSSIFPVNDNAKKEYPDAVGKNSRVIAVNNALRTQASKQGFLFADAYSVLADKRGNLRLEYAQSDGLHLNTSGYQHWTTLLQVQATSLHSRRTK